MTRVSIPRLHSVQLKSGGARVRVLENKLGEPVCHRLRRETESIIERRRHTMAGFAVVAWTADGNTSACVNIVEASRIGQVECPEFVKSALQVYLFARDE